MSDTSKLKVINLYSDLAPVLILKSETGLKSQSEAQSILHKLRAEDETPFQVSILAMRNLCELNLVELKINNDTNLLERTIELTSELYDIGQRQQIFPIIINSQILRSKFKLLNGDLEGAIKALNQAEAFAKAKGLVILLQKVSNEKMNLELQYNKWFKIIKNNENLATRIENLDIEDYLKSIKGEFP